LVVVCGEVKGVAPVEVQELHRRRRCRADEIVGRGEIEMDLGRVVLRADIRVPAPDGRRGELTPPIVLDALERQEGAPGSAALACRQLTLNASKGSRASVDLGALEIEAIAHQDRDRTAERVEAEHGIGADNGYAFDGAVGQEVPVDDIAEGLIDAHAVLVDR